MEPTVFNLLPTQGLLPMVNANTTYCLMQRGGGKTTCIGQRIQHLDRVMSGSQILLFSDTYKRLQDRIVPNIINFWENKLKWVEGVDFVKYKKPPESFKQPIIKLDKFEHVITLSSGTSLCLVSLAVEGSANAYNASAAIGDEVKFCKEEQINTEIVPALRGEARRFGHLAEYMSIWMFTDKFGPNTKWLLQKRKLQNKQAIEMAKVMQLHVWNRQNDLYHAASTATIDKIKDEIHAYEEKLTRLRKNMVYVCEMQPYENKENLGEDYFKRAKRICTPYEFDVAILNLDPDKVEQAFYRAFSSSHKYFGINDYNHRLPFYIALDYNFKIVPMPVTQVAPLPGSVYNTINIVDEVFVKDPKGISDCINDFCDRYSQHVCKEVHYIFDHTAIGRTPIKTTFKHEVVKGFEQNGWMVHEHYIDQPDHDLKHLNINNWLEHDGEHAIRVNADKCIYLIKSIEQSPAILRQGKTEKDKSTEKDNNFPQEESTHFSDAFDMLLWGLIEHNLVQQQQQAVMPQQLTV